MQPFADSKNLYQAETVFGVGTPSYSLTRSVTKGAISNNNCHFPQASSKNGFERGATNRCCD